MLTSLVIHSPHGRKVLSGTRSRERSRVLPDRQQIFEQVGQLFDQASQACSKCLLPTARPSAREVRGEYLQTDRTLDSPARDHQVSGERRQLRSPGRAVQQSPCLDEEFRRCASCKSRITSPEFVAVPIIPSKSCVVECQAAATRDACRASTAYPSSGWCRAAVSASSKPASAFCRAGDCLGFGPAGGGELRQRNAAPWLCGRPRRVKMIRSSQG